MRVARSPHSTKQKPWVRAGAYNRAPTSSDEDGENILAKKDRYYPVTLRRSVKLSRPLLPRLPSSDGDLTGNGWGDDTVVEKPSKADVKAAKVNDKAKLEGAGGEIGARDDINCKERKKGNGKDGKKKREEE